MDDVAQQCDEYHNRLVSLQTDYAHLQEENKALKEEVFVFFSPIFLLFLILKNR
jgi:hypothetical protein